AAWCLVGWVWAVAAWCLVGWVWAVAAWCLVGWVWAVAGRCPAGWVCAAGPGGVAVPGAWASAVARVGVRDRPGSVGRGG
ncbi:hypothetical protein ACW9HG_26230, partial [Nocardia gipuzkoensis]